MADLKFDLSGVSLNSDGTFLKGSHMELDNGTKVTLDTDSVGAFTVGRYGTFTGTKGNSVVSFVAAPALAGQTVRFVDSDKSKTSIGLVQMTDGNDNVSMTGAGMTLFAGKGDDVVSLGTTDKKDVVYLGDGADKVLIADGTGANIADYNYADGDVLVSLGGTFDAGSLMKTGNDFTGKKITIGGATVDAAVTDDVFKLKFARDTSDSMKSEYWGAVGNANVTMDASAIGTDTNLYLDASQAKSALVLGSYGNDSISLASGNGADTLVVGKAGGYDTVAGFDTLATTIADADSPANKADTLWFNGGTLADISIGGGKIIYGKETLKGAAATTGAFISKVTFDGTNIDTAMFANDDGSVLNASVKGVDTYVGTGTATTLVAGQKNGTDVVTNEVNLWDTDHYLNITEVSLDGADTDKEFLVVGNAKHATTIDAGDAKAGVQVLMGGTDPDLVKLNQGGGKKDTIWFGGIEGDAQDTVTGFKTGFKTADASDQDVLYLYDTADFSGIKSAASLAAKSNVITLTNGANISLGSGAEFDEIQVAFAGAQDSVKNFAFDNGSGTVTLNGAADYVLGNVNGTGRHDGSQIKLTSSYTDAAVINLQSTDKYVNIDDVDTSDIGTTDAALVIGSQKYASNVTLKGGTASQVWTANKASNTTAVGDKNIVWFGSADGADYVTGGDSSKATYRLYDASSFDDLVSKFSFKGDTKTQLVSTTNTDNTLTFENVDSKAAEKDIKLLYHDAADNTDKTVTAAVAGKGATLKFATDKQIYGGGASELTFASTYRGDEAALIMGGSFGGYALDSNITNIDASASQAKMTVVANGAKASTFTGGMTENAFWGMGATSDTFVANSLAKDTMWYGTADGNDTFSGAKAGQDSVYLYGTSSSDIDSMITKYEVSDTQAVLTFENKSTLTVSGTAVSDGLVFNTNDGVSYKYDATAKKLVKA